MIVFVHDETCSCERLHKEWEIARTAGLPIKCILDMTNCVKANMIDQVTQTASHLLTHQCTEYTSKYRRNALKEVADWLQEKSGSSAPVTPHATPQPHVTQS